MSQPSFKGFASLQTAEDLLRKVQYDYERLRSEPENVYAAFDFFVSAYHILDWLHPNDRATREAEEKGNLLLQVCSHIANGAKHFEATARQHTSVTDMRVVKGAFARGLFNPKIFAVGGLYITLDGQAAETFGTRMEAVDLAKRVLEHWLADPRLR